jgi:hypothetical protein
MAIRLTINDKAFDTVFEPARQGQPAKLTIRIKFVLHPQDPKAAIGQVWLAASPDVAYQYRGRLTDGERLADGTLKRLKCRGWSVKAWNEFRTRFKWIVERVWNDQIVLLPPDGDAKHDGLSDEDYRKFVDPSKPKVPAHVRCGLELTLADTNAELTPGAWQGVANARMNVVNLDEDERKDFRSYSELICNRDVRFSNNGDDEKWPGVPVIQFAAAHEVGHWLGYWENNTKQHWFEHIEYEECSKLPNHQANDDCEYGRTLGKRMGIMGGGGAATEYDASPWLIRMRRHSQIPFGWKMIPQLRLEHGEAKVSDRQTQLYPHDR